MHRADFSYRLYRLTLGKYLKFRKRLDKSVQSGQFHKYNVWKRRSLLTRIKKIWRKLEQLRFELKVGLSGAALALFLNVGEAQAQLGPFVEKPRSENPLRPPLLGRDMRPAASDVDDDGDVDVLVGFPDGTVRFFRNDGTPEKPAFTWISGPENPFDAIASGSSITLAFADLDGDTDEDLAVVDYFGSSTFWRKDGPNLFTAVTGIGNPLDGVLTGGQGPQITFADVDGDSDLDLVAGFRYYPGEYLIMFENDGSSYVPNSTLQGLAPFGTGPNAPAFANIDGDADLDLFLGETIGSADTYISFFRQDAAGDFSLETGSANPFDGIPFGDYGAPVFVDLDNDGDLDAIVGRNYFKYGLGTFDNSLAYFENKQNETGVFEFEEKNELENPFDGILGDDLHRSNREVSIDFIDIDNNGDLDLLLGGKYGSNLLRYYQFDAGKETFIRQTGASNPFDAFSFANNEATPRVVTLNDPAFKDILMGSGPFNYLLENNQDGTFNFYSSLLDDISIIDDIAANATKYALLDINNDSHQDIFVGTEYSGVQVYLNDGSDNYDDVIFDLSIGLPPPFNDPLTLNSERAKPYASDINHDGYVDLVLGMGNGILQTFVNVDGSYQFAELTDAANPFGGLDFGDDASPTVIDLDEDGDLDVFVGNRFGEISFLENQNQAPVVNLSAGPALTFEAGDPPLSLDPGLSLFVTDDDTDAIRAIVRISGNYVSGQDVLGFTLTGDITAPDGFNAATGEIRFTGRGSMAQYQQVLRSITYQNSSSTPTASTRTITYYLFDHDATDPRLDAVSDASVTVDVLNAGENPSLTTTTSSRSYTGSPIIIDNNLQVIDGDGTLSSATIRITTGFQTAEDVLLFTNQNGITGSFNSSNGTLTLSGAATVANYQTAIRSIQFNNTASPRTSGTRRIEILVNDGSANSNIVEIDILIPNQAPVANLGTTSVAYTGTTLNLAPSLVVTDADDINLESATITIVGQVPGDDELLFTNQNGISGVYSSSTGVLTLTGSSSVANYQTALRSIQYRNNNPTPTPTNRTIQFLVNDGELNSTLRNMTVVYPVPNVAPALVTATTTTTFTGTALPIDNALTLTDADDVIASATVQISTGYVNGEDQLLFTNQNGISGTFDTVTGTLSLSGTTTVANYQAALRSIQYNNAAANRTNANRTITFRVNDGTVNSNTLSLTLQVPNVVPSLTLSIPTVDYAGGNLVVDAGIVLADEDDVNLSSATVLFQSGYVEGEDVLVFTNQNGISGTFNAATGVLTLTGSATLANYQTALRSVAYQNTSNNRSAGNREIAFAVNDGQAASTTGVVLVVVPNNAPVLTSTTATGFYQSGELVINNSITISDTDNAALQGATVRITAGLQTGEDVLVFANQNGITGTYAAATGTLILAGSASVADYQAALRTVQYRNSSANPNTTSRTITFEVTDGTNASNSIITTLSINRPPIVSANPQTTAAGGNVSFSVASILSDPDNNLDLSTLQVVSAEGATVTISGGQIVIDYSGVDDFQGTDVLTITVCDLAGRCSTQSIDIELEADIQVYNGVSPNGDGANDYFKIRYLPAGTRVSIYNRWGDLVFSENNYDNTDRNRRFEGLNDNGNELASGTYFYKIETPQGRTLTGYLTLKR